MNTLGHKLTVTVFGQSHGTAVGCTIEGLPCGFRPDWEALQRFLDRRRPGRSALTTQRQETDTFTLLSGVVDDYTCGAPLTAIFQNADAHSADYDSSLPRPSHADFTARMKFGSRVDLRGGGAFSGRLTAPLCFAGGLALQLLRRRGTQVAAHIAQIGTIQDVFPSFTQPDWERLTADKPFPVLNHHAGEEMAAAIHAAQQEGDSLGGIIRCFAAPLPAGLGNPMFDGIENRLSAALFAIPAVRGVSFGAGFDCAAMLGSQHNDPFCTDGSAVFTATNHAGGILGGITTGMPLVIQAAIKPTPSIAKPQGSVRLSTRQAETLTIHGRHDPCIVPRAVPVVEAVTALTLLDIWLEEEPHGFDCLTNEN